MIGGRRLYDRVDGWLTGLSRVPYAVVLGSAAGVGVLGVGLVSGGGLPVLRALTMALVMFGLECAFGVHQTDG
ncbi:hypothetical protein [Halorussus marinus]|uniref:hypothetical protein n=1 Tax=Halorussus marinus TaxID=2505976 RepID=UPI00106DE76E|nr:hypothetical protein [Halorussus marinus]